MSKSSSNELRVFISSTFRDLQEEREHLVKKIFPEIRALCRKRGITFTEVDLRWGLTDEDVALGQVIRTCLEEIDKCRPYFIGITGERYGYVPELMEYYKDAELLRTYPWLQEAALENSAIIDLEFRHAVLNEESGDDPDSAYFFFRRHRRGHESDVDETEAERLEELKERVRASGAPVEEFRDPGSLGEMVYDALMEIIERDFGAVAPPSPLDEERARHRAFAESRRHAYIPNPEYLQELNAWYADESASPLVIYAESGSGKSSLVSFWCEMQRSIEPELSIIEHYVGIGAGSSDHLSIMRHVMAEIREAFDRTEEIPSKPEEIERDFANWLGFTVGKPLLLVIDGINQLTGRALDLHWLPPMVPPGVKLIITSTVEGTLVDLRSRQWQTLGMQPLSEKEREAVVVRYLSEYRKALSKEQVARLSGDTKCSHPLFLRTLLEELRIDSSHEQLESRIDRYLKTTGTEDLFQQVLERMEDDYGTRAVREVMALIFCSRRGLDETDLAEMTGIGRLKLSTMLSGLDYHLVRKDGVLTFFHDYLRRAVEKRYLMEASSREERYRMLAEYFEGSEVTLPRSLELLHALEALDDRTRLQAALSDIERFVDLWKSEEQEVLRLWSSYEMTEVVEAYRRGVDRWEEKERSSHEELEVRRQVAGLYDRIGAWSAAEEEQRRCLELVRATGDREVEGTTLALLAGLVRRLGRMDEAEQLARESEQIAREIGDRRSIAFAVGTRGAVRWLLCEYPEALDCYREWEQIAREMGDRRGIASAVGSRGNVHGRLGEFPEALDCFREWEQIAREMGDRRGIASAVGNRGIVHAKRGEYPEALHCYGEHEQIARELGDRHGIAGSAANRGFLHSNHGEYQQALDCYSEAEQIAREVGDHRTLSAVVGNRGTVHVSRGEYREALDCYGEQEKIARETGDREGLASVVGNCGVVHHSRGEYQKALDCYRRAADESQEIGDRYGLSCWMEGTARTLLELVLHETRTTSLPHGQQTGPMPAFLSEHLPNSAPQRWQEVALQTARDHAVKCVAISEELSRVDVLFNGRVVLARIDAAEGDGNRAIAQLQTMLEEATDPEQQADLHYWLWKLGVPGHRADALALYEELYQARPKHEDHLRVEELKGEGENA